MPVGAQGFAPLQIIDDALQRFFELVLEQNKTPGMEIPGAEIPDHLFIFNLKLLENIKDQRHNARIYVKKIMFFL